VESNRFRALKYSGTSCLIEAVKIVKDKRRKGWSLRCPGVELTANRTVAVHLIMWPHCLSMDILFTEFCRYLSEQTRTSDLMGSFA
jgi:hypothetical protein